MLNGMFKKTSYVTIAGGSLKNKETTENTSEMLEESLMQEDEQEERPTVPEGLFVKCKKCRALIYTKDLKDNLYICPKCGDYHRVSAYDRMKMIVDEDSFEEWDAQMDTGNPLDFPGYTEKIELLREECGLNEAVVTGRGTILGNDAVIGVMDARFMMASMGSVVGEKITRAIENATAMKLPLILFTCSGGARMQEGMVSLMQMAKTSAALKRHSEAGLAYFTVLTDPTTGGVTASFAMLGDVILAEPGALIGFAGQRVIEQTIGQKLPKGFQRAEFALKHGLIDAIVERQDLRQVLADLMMMHRPYEKVPAQTLEKSPGAVPENISEKNAGAVPEQIADHTPEKTAEKAGE